MTEDLHDSLAEWGDTMEEAIQAVVTKAKPELDERDKE